MPHGALTGLVAGDEHLDLLGRGKGVAGARPPAQHLQDVLGRHAADRGKHCQSLLMMSLTRGSRWVWEKDSISLQILLASDRSQGRAQARVPDVLSTDIPRIHTPYLAEPGPP